jgi:hypothetical protein
VGVGGALVEGVGVALHSLFLPLVDPKGGGMKGYVKTRSVHDQIINTQIKRLKSLKMEEQHQ